MKLVAHACIECLKPGEGMRSPRTPSMPLIGYFAVCSKCGWKNLIRKAAEVDGEVSFSTACVRCGQGLTLTSAPIPGAAA